MSNPFHADILIAGAGLAGLSLALECIRRPQLADKRIVLLDKDRKAANDRTWCFWATADEKLPPALFRSWPNCRFFTPEQELKLDMGPYRYHMVRGLDFYNYAKQTLAQHANIRWVQADIQSIDAVTGVVTTDQGDFSGEWVFNSALRHRLDELNPKGEFTRLLQHFKGWIIETNEPVFDPETVTFMDYRVKQQNDTRFVYVLPFSANTALVEYTVFSAELCPDKEYDDALSQYVENQLGIKAFAIKETEYGVIPMTDVPLKNREGRVVHIGTPGGFVKGSSGYAFLRTQRKIRRFAGDWAENGRPNPALLQSGWRFRFYDAVLLRVLKTNRVPGAEFFSTLFTHLPAALVLKFLDEDTTFAEEIRLLSAPPAIPFSRSAMELIPVWGQI